MFCRTLASGCAALLLGAPPVFASDCPDLGLQGAERAVFCAEFEALLYAPYSPGSDRSSADLEADDIGKIFNSDPLWGEVYRSDPKKTLDLINRIRNAGGLQTD